HGDCPCRDSVVAACGGDHMAAVIRVTANISRWGNMGSSVANAMGVYTPCVPSPSPRIILATGQGFLRAIEVTGSIQLWKCGGGVRPTIDTHSHLTVCLSTAGFDAAQVLRAKASA